MVINDLGRAGAETQLRHLALGLAALGHPVTICSLNGVRIDTGPLLRAGIRVVAFGARDRLARLRALPMLVRMARAADVVHCVTWDATLWARLAAAAARRPVVVTEAAGARQIQVSRSGKQRERWIALHTRLLDRFSFATVAVSRDQLAWLRAEGVAARRLVYVPNAVPIDELRAIASRGVTRADLGIPDDARVVVHVARLRPLKNQRATLEVVARLREELGDVRVVLVGDGPDRRELERQAERLAASEWALFLGWRTDAAALLALADLAVLPSSVEGLPVAVIEAVAVGTPVVASAVGAIPEVLRETGAGIAVPPGDLDAFHRACREVLANAELRERLRRNAGASRHYDAEQMARRYSELLRGARCGTSAAVIASGWD